MKGKESFQIFSLFHVFCFFFLPDLLVFTLSLPHPFLWSCLCTLFTLNHINVSQQSGHKLNYTVSTLYAEIWPWLKGIKFMLVYCWQWKMIMLLKISDTPFFIHWKICKFNHIGILKICWILNQHGKIYDQKVPNLWCPRQRGWNLELKVKLIQ